MSKSRIINRMLGKTPATPTNPRAADTTAPTAPGTPVVSNIVADTVTISFSASTDAVGVVGYAAFLDGGAVSFAESATTAIKLAGLTAGPHSVVIKAFDAGYNYSAASSECFFRVTQRRVRDAVRPPDYSNLTPTHYFDPQAAGSTNAGTFANPFTTGANITAWMQSLSGNMAGKILGFKRGSIYAGALNLYQSADGYTSVGGISGTAVEPFLIVPYGDAEARPLITACRVSTGWVQDSTYPQLWKKLLSAEQELYHIGSISNPIDYHRFPKHSSVANLLAAGAGYACYTGGYLYIYPLDASNPNSGQISETFNDTVFYPCIGRVSYKDQADTGYIGIHGIHFDGSAKEGLVIGGGGASTVSIKSITIDDCAVSRIGIDKAGSGALSAINITGISNALRINGVKVSGNLIYNALNNATETTFVDGLLHEYNSAYKIGGKNILELYGSNSNCISRYNYGECFAASTTYEPLGNIGFGQMGIWQSGYVGNTSTPSAADNQNNIFAFNHTKSKGNSANLQGGSCVLVGNILQGGIPNTAANVQIGGATTNVADVTLQNNIIYQSGSATVNCFPIASSNAGDVIRGNNNLCYWKTTASVLYRFHGTADSLANFKTAVNLVTAGSQSNNLFANPQLGDDGAPLASSPAINFGKSLISGVDGVTVTGITDGALGYRTDLAGNVLSANHAGCYQR